MFLIEAIIALTVLMVVLSVGLFVLKFAFAMVMIPVKIVFFLTKGLLGLLILLPVLLIVGTLVTAVLPLAALIFLAPVLLLGGLACALAGF